MAAADGKWYYMGKMKIKLLFAAVMAASALGAADVQTLVNSIAADKAADILCSRLEGVDASVLLTIGEIEGMRHDGYLVTRDGDEYTVTASRPRALLYAAGESELWLGRDRTLREAAFAFRMANWTKSRRSAAEWIAATGANIVHAGRRGTVSLETSMPEVFAALPEERREALRRAKRSSERAALTICGENTACDVPTYPLLYGCDAMKWNRELCEAFLKVHPEARGTDPGRSWEKGILCPSEKATWDFVRAYVGEFASLGPYEGIVATFWDDYGMNCKCEKCRKNGMHLFSRQVAKLVETYEEALKPLGKKLIVRTWASGAPHFLGEEWVNAPGYAGKDDAIATWGKTFEKAKSAVIQTKVYNADCQPDAPFSNLLGEAKKRGFTEFAEWQITGQTVGRGWLPASVCGHTARTVKKAMELVGPEGGVAIYAGGYKNGGYEALDDIANSINIKMWRQLTWNPEDDVDRIWLDWARPIYGESAEAAVAALKATEKAAAVSFSPLGFGAPTESGFAGSIARREDLLRYTNRHFLPEYRGLLAPTKENISKVVAEKDAALASVERAIAGLGEAGGAVDELRIRLKWLKAHLTVSKALDEGLWRVRRIDYLSRMQQGDLEELKAVKACFDVVRACGKDLFAHDPDSKMSFYPDRLGNHEITLGSPVRLMREIWETALERTEKILGPQ